MSEFSEDKIPCVMFGRDAIGKLRVWDAARYDNADYTSKRHVGWLPLCAFDLPGGESDEG